MTTEEFDRKLTAILSADVEGYSRLMGEDEDATIRTLTTYRELMSTLIQKHRGRVVDSPGDNLLAEFTSVVDSVRCAVEIQEELRIRNAELPAARKMQFRIGVNLGDVIEEEGRIYGDGVNVAARIESLADGGGICISGTVYDQVQDKLGLEYKSLGEKEVKNIAKPIRVYRVLSSPGAEAKIEPASVERMEHPLPEKPSIAVLPFENLSGDPEQEFFSDGLTEEIITALSKIPGLFVIARNSTFTYKGKPVKVQRVAEELGVQYVLEGSVRKGGDMLRITAQLIDALTGYHLWAERYDRDLSMKSIFEIQDGITVQVLEALQIKLTIAEYTYGRRGRTDNLEAYLKAMQALELQQPTVDIENIMMARQLLEEAIALATNYSDAYVMQAHNFRYEAERGLTDTPMKSYEQGLEMAKKAISLDDMDSNAYAVLGICYAGLDRMDQASDAFERAMVLDPNNPEAYTRYAYHFLRPEKRYEEAFSYIKKAKRLNPLPPFYYYWLAGLIYREAGNYEKAIPEFKEYINIQNRKGRPVHESVPRFLTIMCLELDREEEAYAAATELFKIRSKVPMENAVGVQTFLINSFLRLGREEEAYTTATELLKIKPKFPLKHYLNTNELQNNAAKDRLLEVLYKAELLQKEKDFAAETINWKSDADGVGKDGVFMRKNPPAFSFKYPTDSAIRPHQSHEIFTVAVPPDPLPSITVSIRKTTSGFIDFMREYEESYKEVLENVGMGTNIAVSKKQPLPPQTYGEDYPAQELEFDWMYGDTFPFTSYVNVIAKEDYCITISGHMARSREGIDWIKAIFKTIDLEP
jgi:adenylate cyclase